MEIDNCFKDSSLFTIANVETKIDSFCCTGQQVLLIMLYHGPLLSTVLHGRFERSCSQHRVNSFSQTFCWWTGLYWCFRFQGPLSLKLRVAYRIWNIALVLCKRQHPNWRCSSILKILSFFYRYCHRRLQKGILLFVLHNGVVHLQQMFWEDVCSSSCSGKYILESVLQILPFIDHQVVLFQNSITKLIHVTFFQTSRVRSC